MKILFFDIDGTLVNMKGQIPESADRALRMAKEKGHKMYICTGRNMVQVPAFLKESGLFDGFVSSAGAKVICCEDGQNLQLFEHTIDSEPLAKMLAYFRSVQIAWMLQTQKDACVSTEGAVTIKRVFREVLHMAEERSATIIESMQVDDEPEKRTDIEKLVYYNSPDVVSEVQKKVGDYFEVAPFSLGKNPAPSIGEITVRGINKAVGMEKVLEHYGLSQSDAIAFGDGPNDLEMMDYAGYSVCLGNGRDEVKARADLVTDDIDEDGIYNAMKKLQLI